MVSKEAAAEQAKSEELGAEELLGAVTGILPGVILEVIDKPDEEGDGFSQSKISLKGLDKFENVSGNEYWTRQDIDEIRRQQILTVAVSTFNPNVSVIKVWKSRLLVDKEGREKPEARLDWLAFAENAGALRSTILRGLIIMGIDESMRSCVAKALGLKTPKRLAENLI